MEASGAAEQVAGLAKEAMVALVHVAAALSQMVNQNPEAAANELTVVVDSRSEYADEALYWRARIAGAEAEPAARSAAAKDYVELLRRLPEGGRRREVQVLFAAMTEPGRVLSAEEARSLSMRNLEAIGRALHGYAADHGGRLPRALHDLLDGYVQDPAVLVRPGAREDGGGRPYAYRPGLTAELVAADQSGRPTYAAAGAAVAWETEAASPGGTGPKSRLVLLVDGRVRAVQEQESCAPAAR